MAQKSKNNKDKDEEDISLLRSPIQIHGKSVEHILNGVHYGTPELRGLLLDECDIIFECKVCRALFRDLPNFISHKRKYCTKSATENNHLAISKMPDEKVFVVLPQEPESTESNMHQTKPRSKPSLTETISRIRSGELGHSQAFQVYTDAANKLQQQREETKVATIRTRAIPTNSNAVFMDVNLTSVNIHERPSTASNSSSHNNRATSSSVIRKREVKSNTPPESESSRLLRKDCKNSEELEKLLLKELKEIQQKVKQKVAVNKSDTKQVSARGEVNGIQKSESDDSVTTARQAIIPQDDPKVWKVHSNDSESKVLANVSSGTKVCPPENKHKRKQTRPYKEKAQLPSANSQSSKNEQISPHSLSKEENTAVKSETVKIEIPAEIEPTSNVEKSPELFKRSDTCLKTDYKLRQKSFNCQECNAFYSTQQNLSLHEKMIHSTKKTFFPCLYCNRVFHYLTSVMRHLQINHHKTKIEVCSLRKLLKSKVYTKVLPYKEGSVELEEPSGLRKSLRCKQELTVKKSSSNSYVLQPIGKPGRLRQIKVQPQNSNESAGTERNLNSSSGSSETISFKKEVEGSSYGSTKGPTSVTNTKNNIPADELKIPQSPSKSFSFALRHIRFHTCKKCRRRFGRMLTYKNHIKVCQGTVTAASRRRRRPSENMPIQGNLRGRGLRGRRTTQVLDLDGKGNHFSGSISKGSVTQSTPSPRSSRNETVRYEHLNRQDNSLAETQGLFINTVEPKKIRSSSISSSSSSKSSDMASKVKCEFKIESHVTRAVSQKLGSQTLCTSSKSQSDAKMNEVADSEEKKVYIKSTTNTRSSNTIKLSSPFSSSIINTTSPIKSTSTIPDIIKHKRSSILDKNKMSHLVPCDLRGSVSSNASVSNSTSSDSTINERPKRKRRVPTRNMEAMEMLSKIHNPDKDSPPSKKCAISSKEGLNRDKPTSCGQSQADRRKRGKELKKEEITTPVEGAIKGRSTKGQSRLLVLGRNNPRGAKIVNSLYHSTRVDKLIDSQRIKCLVCGEHYSCTFNLRKHVIRIHLQWRRYQCKVCRYASFDRSECTKHIFRNHRQDMDHKDPNSVDKLITDLTLKKGQTLRNDLKSNNSKESNIYARPNVRKMPRLAERTINLESSGSSSLSSPDTLKSKNVGGTDHDHRTLPHIKKSESLTQLLNHPSRMDSSSSDFVKNSSQVVDVNAHNSGEQSLNKGTGMGVLHTRKGVYTKTVPLIPPKEKSALKETEMKEMEQDASKDIVDDNEGKSLTHKSNSSFHSLKNSNIFEKMGLSHEVSFVNNGGQESQLDEIKTNPHIFENFNNDTAAIESDCDTSCIGASSKASLQQSIEPLSNGPRMLQSASAELKINCSQLIDKDVDEFPLVSNPSHSPKKRKSSPSFVAIEPHQLSACCEDGTASTSSVVTKSPEELKLKEEIDEVNQGPSSSDVDSELLQPKTTGIDDGESSFTGSVLSVKEQFKSKAMPLDDFSEVPISSTMLSSKQSLSSSDNKQDN